MEAEKRVLTQSRYHDPDPYIDQLKRELNEYSEQYKKLLAENETLKSPIRGAETIPCMEITSKIKLTLYKGHLPVAQGHLDAEGGKTWLAVAVTSGYTRMGYGTKVVKALCEYADKGGWDLWLTCPDNLKDWYGRFGFVFDCKKEVNYIKRVHGKERK